MCSRFYEYLIAENSFYNKHWSNSSGSIGADEEIAPLQVEKKFLKIRFFYC